MTSDYTGVECRPDRDHFSDRRQQRADRYRAWPALPERSLAAEGYWEEGQSRSVVAEENWNRRAEGCAQAEEAH